MEDRRFNLIDPAGNRLLIGAQHTAPQSTVDRTTHFARAFETSYRLMYAKDEPAAAAKVLDLALSKAEDVTVTLRYRAYVLRADIAVSMNERDTVRTFIREAERLRLSDTELEEVKEERGKLNELRVDLEDLND
ncbi:hypothetical protein [Paenibacillus cellulositrophicus]|uniref:hypothetical protein n=1 Tax=Paenibacillus cellulositrophicus TaxID=562959 RepID=UPI00126760CF|nr:hypothetical protein [Paenibacillus cellulositrophicus]